MLFVLPMGGRGHLDGTVLPTPDTALRLCTATPVALPPPPGRERHFKSALEMWPGSGPQEASGDMSATADPRRASARPVPASERRDAALQDLADALALLGDDASRATEASRDVRLHIVACQSEHLSAEVRALVKARGVHRELALPPGFAASTISARRAFDAAAQEILPRPLGDSLQWLLLLAEAAAP